MNYRLTDEDAQKMVELNTFYVENEKITPLVQLTKEEQEQFAIEMLKHYDK